MSLYVLTIHFKIYHLVFNLISAIPLPTYSPSKSQDYFEAIHGILIQTGEDFLAVQWLRVGAFTAVGLGSIPGQGAKIPQAVRYGQKKKKKKKSNWGNNSLLM